MPNLDKIKLWLDERLPALLAEHQVPGAAVAVLADDEIIDAAAGVLNTATGVEATADSVFQVGSITKVWTATLVMTFVDDGTVALRRLASGHLALADYYWPGPDGRPVTAAQAAARAPERPRETPAVEAAASMSGMFRVQ